MTKRLMVTALSAATAVAAISGCGDNKSATSSPSSQSTTSAASSSTSASAQPSDYSALLIKASDLPGNEPFTLAPPTLNPNGQPGVAGSFSNQAGTRVIGDTILILPDATAAATALEGAKSALPNSVTGTPETSAVGSGGTVVSGTSPDGSKAVTILLFTEGKAFTTLEFDSAPGDPVPPDAAVDVGQKQDTAIKNGLPA